MRQVIIICQRFYDRETQKISVGGIQHYIKCLSKVIRDMGDIPRIIQYSEDNFEVSYEGCIITGVDTSGEKHLRDKNALLYKKSKEYKKDGDVLIYATEQLVQKESKDYAIGIQHGIYWDITTSEKCSRIKNIFYLLKQCFWAIVQTQRISYLSQVVCVDYNFINWYRTQIKSLESKFHVVPNFTPIPAYNEGKHSSDLVRVVFARRFQTYRGTRLFANAISRILQTEKNIEVVVAGEGPDEDYLHKSLDMYPNVIFSKYSSESSLAFHKDKDIAIVPTVGSEGTSLSLLEAMASQCAVVCTNVGGMTNIVIDGYNGIMINPDEDELYTALLKLIKNRELRKIMSDRAYSTVKEGFSIERWEARWRTILNRS